MKNGKIIFKFLYNCSKISFNTTSQIQDEQIIEKDWGTILGTEYKMVLYDI